MCQPGRPSPQGLSQLGSPGFARLPEGEVHRVLFLLVDLDAGAGLHVVEAAVRELAVVVVARRPGSRRRRSAG